MDSNSHLHDADDNPNSMAKGTSNSRKFDCNYFYRPMGSNFNYTENLGPDQWNVMSFKAASSESLEPKEDFELYSEDKLQPQIMVIAPPGLTDSSSIVENAVITSSDSESVISLESDLNSPRKLAQKAINEMRSFEALGGDISGSSKFSFPLKRPSLPKFTSSLTNEVEVRSEDLNSPVDTSIETDDDNSPKLRVITCSPNNSVGVSLSNLQTSTERRSPSHSETSREEAFQKTMTGTITHSLKNESHSKSPMSSQSTHPNSDSDSSYESSASESEFIIPSCLTPRPFITGFQHPTPNTLTNNSQTINLFKVNSPSNAIAAPLCLPHPSTSSASSTLKSILKSQHSGKSSSLTSVKSVTLLDDETIYSHRDRNQQMSTTVHLSNAENQSFNTNKSQIIEQQPTKSTERVEFNKIEEKRLVSQKNLQSKDLERNKKDISTFARRLNDMEACIDSSLHHILKIDTTLSRLEPRQTLFIDTLQEEDIPMLESKSIQTVPLGFHSLDRDGDDLETSSSTSSEYSPQNVTKHVDNVSLSNLSKTTDNESTEDGRSSMTARVKKLQGISLSLIGPSLQLKQNHPLSKENPSETKNNSSIQVPIPLPRRKTVPETHSSSSSSQHSLLVTSGNHLKLSPRNRLSSEEMVFSSSPSDSMSSIHQPGHNSSMNTNESHSHHPRHHLSKSEKHKHLDSKLFHQDRGNLSMQGHVQSSEKLSSHHSHSSGNAYENQPDFLLVSPSSSSSSSQRPTRSHISSPFELNISSTLGSKVSHGKASSLSPNAAQTSSNSSLNPINSPTSEDDQLEDALLAAASRRKLERRLLRYLEAGREERISTLLTKMSRIQLEKLMQEFNSKLVKFFEERIEEMQHLSTPDLLIDVSQHPPRIHNEQGVLGSGVQTIQAPPSSTGTLQSVHRESGGTLTSTRSRSGITNPRDQSLTRKQAPLARKILHNCPTEGPPPPMGVTPKPRPPSAMKASIFDEKTMEKVDTRVRELMSSLEPSTFSQMVHTLTQTFKNDVEKVRALFIWMTLYNPNSMEFPTKASPESLLGMLRRMKSGQVNLNEVFQKLCRYAGIHCTTVSGYSKGAGYRPGMSLRENQAFRNSWCAVYVADGWRFVNCIWGSRHFDTAVVSSNTLKRTSHSRGRDKSNNPLGTFSSLNSLATTLKTSVSLSSMRPSENGRLCTVADMYYLEETPIRYRCDEFYFLTDPSQHIFEHFPDNKRWQLLPHCVTMEDFLRMPLLKSPFFNSKLSLEEKYFETLVTRNGSVTIKIRLPHFVWISAILENCADLSVIKGVTLIRIVNDRLTVKASPAQPGRFFLSIYIQDHYPYLPDPPRLPQSKLRELACSFQIHCAEHNHKHLLVGRYPPKLDHTAIGSTPYARHLGVTMGDQQHGERNPFIKIKGPTSYVDIPIVIPSNVNVWHEMRLYQQTTSRMISCSSYALLQSSTKSAFYRLVFPTNGYYLFHLYGETRDSLQTNDEKSKRHVIYRLLIDCRRSKSETIAPFPVMNPHWSGCNLHRPLQQHLLINKEYTFSIESVRFRSLAVVINGDRKWEDLHEFAPNRWKGKFNVGAELGTLSIYGRYGADENEMFHRLLDYQLVATLQ